VVNGLIDTFTQQKNLQITATQALYVLFTGSDHGWVLCGAGVLLHIGYIGRKSTDSIMNDTR